MATLAKGNEVQLYTALFTSLTVTPGATGYVDFGCSSPMGSTAPAGRRVHAAETISVPAGSTVFLRAEIADAAYADEPAILTVDGGVVSLSEVTPEVLANPTATTTVLAVPGIYTGYRCTTATGNITVYDNTAASGKVLVPTTALALGSFPIFGAGNSRALQVTIGVTVVLSGAGVVYAGVEAA
jgi:hypothetical protein